MWWASAVKAAHGCGSIARSGEAKMFIMVGMGGQGTGAMGGGMEMGEAGKPRWARVNSWGRKGTRGGIIMVGMGGQGTGTMGGDMEMVEGMEGGN